MSVDQSIIERIRKILSKTEQAGCTEAEANAAFVMANKLLAQHNLDMSVFEREVSDYIEESACETGRWSLEHNLAYGIIKNYFFVSPYLLTISGNVRNRRRLMIFGTSDNVRVASFTFNELLDSFDRLWKDYRAKNRLPLSEKRAYITGVATGFSNKMRDERRILEAEQDIIKGSGSTAIVLASVSKKTDIAFREKHKNMKNANIGFAPTRGSQGSFDAGIQAGRSLNINRKIDSRSQKQLGD